MCTFCTFSFQNTPPFPFQNHIPSYLRQIWYCQTYFRIFHDIPQQSKLYFIDYQDIPMIFPQQSPCFFSPSSSSFVPGRWSPSELGSWTTCGGRWRSDFFSAYNKISTKITLNGEYILYHGLVYLTILYPIISFCILPHHLHLIISHGILVYHIASYYITIISCLCILIFMYIYIYILLYCYILLSLMISCCSILYHIVSRPSSAMAWKGSYI